MVKDPEWLRALEADRTLQGFRNRQFGSKTPVTFSHNQATGEFYWPEANSNDRIEKLISDGAVKKWGGSVSARRLEELARPIGV